MSSGNIEGNLTLCGKGEVRDLPFPDGAASVADGRFHPSPAVQESIERDKILIYERHNALELAAEADKLVQELIAEGKLTPEIVEGWGKEHMRTPYTIDNEEEL